MKKILLTIMAFVVSFSAQAQVFPVSFFANIDNLMVNDVGELGEPIWYTPEGELRFCLDGSVKQKWKKGEGHIYCSQRGPLYSLDSYVAFKAKELGIKTPMIPVGYELLVETGTIFQIQVFAKPKRD